MDIVDPTHVPQFERSNPSAQLPPFPTLIGEYPLLVSKTADGNAMVTNFRFCVCERRSFINVPLMMVGELNVIEAAKRLRIGCKDGATYICTFATTEDCTACTALLKEKTGHPLSRRALFAYSFYAAAMHKKGLGTAMTQLEEEQLLLCETVDPKFAYSFDKEVKRLRFDTYKRKTWRMSHANEHFEFCPTYPKIHILPATVNDEKLKVSLDFRASKRFPSVVWRDVKTGMVLIRSSQPLSSFLGLSYYTNHADVSLIEEIVKACNKDFLAIAKEEKQSRAGHAVQEPAVTNGHGQGSGEDSNPTVGSQKEDGAHGSLVCDDVGGANGHGASASNGNSHCDDNLQSQKLAIVDCRSLAGVWGNSFKGGGTEDEAVYKCNIEHLDLANIHTVRDSFIKLRALCHAYVEGTFYKNLAGCMWLTYISALLRGANIVVELMHVMRRPVLVHCSDGWDRTSQIASLSELMMDPYYRKIEGFQVLVEREWLHFGHKFGERGGHDPSCKDTNQISPIFLQFLDCTYQLTHQYPSEFQFNEAYLVKLLQNSQSCLFGNFLHNCQKERENCPNKTASVWSLLQTDRSQFVNLLYKPTDKVLIAKTCEHDILLWKSVYMAGLSPMPHVGQTDFYHEATQTGAGEETGNLTSDGIARSKSMDDLSKISVDSGRRNSDPSITQSQEIASSPAISSVLNDTVSAELLSHLQEESPPLVAKPSLSEPHLDENDKDSQPKISPTSASIKARPDASDSSSVNGDSSAEILIAENGEFHEGSATISLQTEDGEFHEDSATISLQTEDGEFHEGSATISLQSTSSEIVKPSTETLSGNGQHCDSKPSNEPISINDLDDVFLSTDSGAQSLDAYSSVVFCQEKGSTVEDASKQTMCCDRQVNGPDSKVLSEKFDVSNLCSMSSGYNSVETEHVDSSHQTSSHSMDNTAVVANSSPKVTSSNGVSTFVYSSKQTSLLAERLALSSELDIPQNGNAQNINTIMNGKVGQFSDEDNHSRKFGSDLPATLKVQAQREVSRKVENGCSMGGFCKGGARIYTQVIKAATVDHNFLTGITSPSKSLNCLEIYGVDCSKVITNSVSTDTLTGDLELCSPTYSKPLEVRTQDQELTTVPVPYTASPVVLPSSVKNNSGQSDDVCDVAGANFGARKTRPLSGSRRDFASPPNMLITVEQFAKNIKDSHVVQQPLAAVDRQPSIAQHIDVDGLTLFCDERQDRLTDEVAALKRKIQHLKHHLNEAINIIQMYGKGINSHHQQSQVSLIDDMATDSDGGELGSLGAVSNASDTSWETIDERDSMIVKWIPDSAVTHCSGCDARFSVYRRKHHCRNCGEVYCAECSNFQAPVPHQQLSKPERVCRRCHSHLLQLSPGASSDGRIPTIVADG